MAPGAASPVTLSRDPRGLRGSFVPALCLVALSVGEAEGMRKMGCVFILRARWEFTVSKLGGNRALKDFGGNNARRRRLARTIGGTCQILVLPTFSVLRTTRKALTCLVFG